MGSQRRSDARVLQRFDFVRVPHTPTAKPGGINERRGDRQLRSNIFDGSRRGGLNPSAIAYDLIGEAAGVPVFEASQRYIGLRSCRPPSRDEGLW